MKHEEWVNAMTAEKYILDELSPVEREQFEEHYFECPECAGSVQKLAHLRDAVRQGFCREPEPISDANPLGKWRRAFQAWLFRPQAALTFAAVAFAAFTGYQNSLLKSQLQPQVLESITLQPASRGDAEPVYSRPSTGFILLEADVPGASGNLAWTVTTNGGQQAATGQGPAPEAGVTFKVLVPAGSLPVSDYVLDVRSDTGRQWKFPFRAGTR